MPNQIDVPSAVESIRKQLYERRHEKAFTEFKELLCSCPKPILVANEETLRELIGRFFKNKSRDLSDILEQRLNGSEIAMEDEKRPLFSQEMRKELANLSNHHIFQWKTYYRDYFGSLFDRLFSERDDHFLIELLDISTKEIEQHASDIFRKGYRHLSSSKGNNVDALSKSMSGLQSFLSIPIEIYSTLAFKVRDGKEAVRLRRVCSALLEGIFFGYGAARLGSQNGWGVLPRFPRAWVHSIAFLDSNSCERITRKLEPGEFQTGMIGTVVPIVTALDRLMLSLSGDDFCLPRIGQFSWGARRLEVSLSLPNAVTDARYLEIHCYLSSGFLNRNTLEESANRAANLIAGQLRPDLKEWVEAHDILRTTFVDTDEADAATNVRRTLEVLNHELAKYMGPSGRSEPITLNLAKTFPLQNPFLARYFIVQRKSVRDLLRAFERDTGVRLWCSVRRSGKTTACFDLGAASENAIVVNQTMEHTEQYQDANVFSSAFSAALETGRQLSDIVPLIPRKAGMFQAPNALISDLVELIDSERSAFNSINKRGGSADADPLVILVISRSTLTIPGGCSPAQLPDWFPRLGGTIVDVPIEDLTFSADASLSCSEASTPAICESLYDVEVALLSRLTAALESRPDKVRALFLLLLDAKEDPAKLDPAILLSSWGAAAALVTERRGFRPAVAKGNGVVARLVRLCGTTSPEHLQKVGRTIGEALSCSSKSEGSIVSVLYRSTWPETNDYSKFGRNLLVTLYATYQYVTAAAHSDQYPTYPLPLIFAICSHLAGELKGLSKTLHANPLSE